MLEWEKEKIIDLKLQGWRYDCESSRKAKLKLYHEQVQSYEQFIKEVSSLLLSISHKNNSIFNMELLTLMLHDGLFSYSGLYKPNAKADFFDIYGTYGLDVIGSHGVCRHVTSFNNDVLSIMNVESESATGVLFDNLSDVDMDEHANHSLNLVRYSYNYYGFDSLNKLCLRLIDADKQLFSDIKQEEGATFRYCPIPDALANCLDLKELKIKEQRIIYRHSSKTPTREQITTIITKADTLYKKNKEHIEKAMLSLKPLKEKCVRK